MTKTRKVSVSTSTRQQGETEHTKAHMGIALFIVVDWFWCMVLVVYVMVLVVYVINMFGV